MQLVGARDHHLGYAEQSVIGVHTRPSTCRSTCSSEKLWVFDAVDYACVLSEKPGQWMYDAVEALKAHRAAEDQPP
eukprot:scaffold114147_cov18-Tisochrysis_lutea.AAC.1